MNSAEPGGLAQTGATDLLVYYVTFAKRPNIPTPTPEVVLARPPSGGGLRSESSRTVEMKSRWSSSGFYGRLDE